MSRLRAGKVITIRISPKDCLSIIDICKTAGFKRNTSFPSTVSQALKMILEAYRRAEIIPTRQGFEWTEMMQEYEESLGSDREEGIDIRKLMQRPELEELKSLSAVRAIAKDDPELWTEEREERYQQLVRMQA